MNLARFLAWSLILVSALLSSPNVPALMVSTIREIINATTRRFFANRVAGQ
jgi:hypothetical protein